MNESLSTTETTKITEESIFSASSVVNNKGLS